MADDLWNKRRALLEDELRKAAMRLFEHMREPAAFFLPLHPDSDYVVALGTKTDLADMLSPDKNWQPYLGTD